MKIDGKLIATEIKSNLKEKITILRQKNIIPHLAVILVGNDPSSEAYVRQKQKVGEELGIKVSLFRIASGKNTWEEEALRHLGGVRSTPPRWRNQKKELLNLVKKLNNDPLVHGIIIQRPVPIEISKEELDLLVTPEKDVDGFHPKSPFTPPIASAVIKILEWVYKSVKDTSAREHPRGVPQAQHHPWGGGIAKVEEFKKDFINWLKKQKILVIGRGETAGKPIAETLKKLTDKITIAHSQTTNLKELCLTSDIIISCVGKRPFLRRPEGRSQKGSFIVRRDMVSPSTLLIGVGLHQENGKLATDYDQDEIAEKTAFYTPVPGGVGPVNVACLFENLVISCGTVRGFS